MLENIRKSRQFNEKKTKVSEPEADLKLNNDDFRFLLLEQTDWSPVKFFVIGAAIWWKLAEYEISRILTTGLEELKNKAMVIYLRVPYLESFQS